MMNHSNDLSMSASFTTSLIRPQSLITGSSSKFKSSSAEKVSDTAQAPVSSRWNPTPEQVQILEEMFRRGTRSPTAEHIQQITTLLRRFGRVEGKNVFYWFQNHKARERQRRRREKLEITPGGVRRACCEVEEWSTWKHLSISKSTSLPEEHVSAHRTQTSSGNGWTHIQIQEMSLPSSTAAPNAQDHGIGNQHRQYQMLELFPLGNGSNNVCEKQSQVSTTTISTSHSQTQFVDFLPLSM